MASRQRLYKDNAVKRARTAYPCGVRSVECQQEDNSVCMNCQAWMHTKCINISNKQLNIYSLLSNAQFYCLQCAKDASGRVNFRACLSRIAACAPRVFRMRQQAEREQLLLSFYCRVLPECWQPSADHVVTDAVSVALLSKHGPWLLWLDKEGMIQQGGYDKAMTVVDQRDNDDMFLVGRCNLINTVFWIIS